MWTQRAGWKAGNLAGMVRAPGTKLEPLALVSQQQEQERLLTAAPAPECFPGAFSHTPLLLPVKTCETTPKKLPPPSHTSGWAQKQARSLWPPVPAHGSPGGSEQGLATWALSSLGWPSSWLLGCSKPLPAEERAQRSRAMQSTRTQLGSKFCLMLQPSEVPNAAFHPAGGQKTPLTQTNQ